MESCDILVYFMSENGQDLENIANPHWAVLFVFLYFNSKTKYNFNKTAQ